MTDNRAHARNTDPQTSHDAADAVTPQLPAIQKLVEAYAKAMGPVGFWDRKMCEDNQEWPESSLRTRRSELTRRNIILDSGQRVRLDNANQHILWVHRDFVDNPPPIVEEDRALQSATLGDLKHDARDMAVEIDRYAAQMRGEGRVFHHRLSACAALLRQLAR